MYVVLGLLIIAFFVWFFVFRDTDDVEEALREEDEAPYKLEPPDNQK